MSARKTYSYEPTDSSFLLFLYRSFYGRLLLALISRPFVSKLGGRYMNSKLSKHKIEPFIKKNGIDMSDYESADYSSFNSFFTRKIKVGKRPFDDSPTTLISPCDALLSAYRIDNESIFFIKGVPYTVESLLKDGVLAQRFAGGIALVFRLCVNHYHRYIYFDSGSQEKSRFIGGVLHTVQPITLEKYDYFKENCREVTLLHTDNFGDAVMVEVGALMVGRISNLHREEYSFRRGEEKGMFEFGGSTVVLLMQQGIAEPDGELIDNTSKGMETAVSCGETIGNKII